jgi:hypothetical protein
MAEGPASLDENVFPSLAVRRLGLESVASEGEIRIGGRKSASKVCECAF